jgi:hypothetical protein
MAELIILVGLPASGKKWIMRTARFQGYHQMSNILTDGAGYVTPRVTEKVLDAGRQGHQKIIVSDVAFCRQERLFEFCLILSGWGFRIKVLYFANNPSACKLLARKDGRGSRDDMLIDELSAIYNPPDSAFYQEVQPPTP